MIATTGIDAATLKHELSDFCREKAESNRGTSCGNYPLKYRNFKFPGGAAQTFRVVGGER